MIGSGLIGKELGFLVLNWWLSLISDLSNELGIVSNILLKTSLYALFTSHVRTDLFYNDIICIVYVLLLLIRNQLSVITEVV